jgi:hypothetical protein
MKIKSNITLFQGFNLSLISISLFMSVACHEVPKVKLPDELKQEIDAGKPSIISPAEISSTAQEIGDSLLKTIRPTTSFNFSIGQHKISLFAAQDPLLLQDKKLKEQFDAFEYSYQQDSTFLGKGLVQYKRTMLTASYQNTIILENKFYMVQMSIDLGEVNRKIVQKRLAEKAQRRLERDSK